MAEQEKKTNQERIKEITESIEAGIRELFESGTYQSYLSTMSRFHKYSLNNTVLIHMQKPDATLVAGFNAWKNKFGRHVKKGEKGIQILAPAAVQKKVQETVLDPDTHAPLLDADGNVVTEEKTVISVPHFKPVTVFDVSQTEGKPLPALAKPLTGDVEHYEAFVEALRRSSPVPIAFEQMAPTTDGYFSASDQRIAIRPGMSEVQTVTAMVHEIGHSRLHDYDKLRAEALAAGGKEPVIKDRRTEEVEAESVAYSVCQYYGIETAENSFGYIAAWSKGKELKELKASLNTINKTASDLITDIDRNLTEILRERGLDQEQEAEQKEAPEEEAPSVSSTSEAPAEMIADVSAAPHTPDQSVDPYLAYARAVCDHAEELGRAGMIVLPFGGHDKETFAVLYADTLRGGLTAAKQTLDDYGEQTGYPTPEKLYQMLDALKAYRDSTLTYKLNQQALDPGSSFITSYRPDGQVEQNILFSGSTELCSRIVTDLQDGILSTDQVRALSRMSDEGATEEELQEAIDPVLGHSDDLPSEPPQELPALQPLDTYPMPDVSTEPDALEKAGCPDAAAMLPLYRDRAKELLAEGFSIYMIDAHGDPMMCFDEAEIEAAGDHLFALERYEWEKSPDFRALILDQRIESQAEREAAFLHYPAAALAIYQISDQSPQRRDRLFADMDSLKKYGMKPTRDHYDLIYTGTLADHPAVKTPEDAFRVFNLDRPHDFGGHSLSVSDIIAFQRSGVVTYHYCDSFGFAEIPDFPLSRDLIRADQLLSDAIKTQGYFRVRSAVNQFQDADGMVSKSAMLRHYYGTDTYDDLVSLLKQQENYLKNAEMAMEDDYNMIDGIINNGPKDQGPPKPEQAQPERPSLRARLREETEQEQYQQQKARQKRDERSI